MAANESHRAAENAAWCDRFYELGAASNAYDTADALRGLCVQSILSAKGASFGPATFAAKFADNYFAYAAHVDADLASKGLNGFVDAVTNLSIGCKKGKWPTDVTADFLVKSCAEQLSQKEAVDVNTAGQSDSAPLLELCSMDDLLALRQRVVNSLAPGSSCPAPAPCKPASAASACVKPAVDSPSHRTDELFNPTPAAPKTFTFRPLQPHPPSALDAPRRPDAPAERMSPPRGRSTNPSLYTCEPIPQKPAPAARSFSAEPIDDDQPTRRDSKWKKGNDRWRGGYAASNKRMKMRGKAAWGEENDEDDDHCGGRGRRADARDVVDADGASGPGEFKTARQQLVLDEQKRAEKGRCEDGSEQRTVGPARRPCMGVGLQRRTNDPFVPPLRRDGAPPNDPLAKASKSYQSAAPHSSSASALPLTTPDGAPDPRLAGIDPKLIEVILNEVLDSGVGVSWNDIAGLEYAKKAVYEMIIHPILRPDIYSGLRVPSRGLLLFGPPGTGKTMIGRCIASQSKSKFFNISASSLMSKWMGESERLVRALFAVARCMQPAVIFIDEVDSLLSQRKDSENEAGRRVKTEFLVQMDGVGSQRAEERVLVVGATNRPAEIDDAARRRFTKRLYIPLPNAQARLQLVKHLFAQQTNNLSPDDFQWIVRRSNGYSGADLDTLCHEAAMGPLRTLTIDIQSVEAAEVRPVDRSDFQAAFELVKKSVSSQQLTDYVQWNEQFGSWQVTDSIDPPDD